MNTRILPLICALLCGPAMAQEGYGGLAVTGAQADQFMEDSSVGLLRRVRCDTAYWL